jgi:hypothetical protein
MCSVQADIWAVWTGTDRKGLDMIGTDDRLDGMAQASMTGRELAGSIVRDEIARAHLTVRAAAERWDMAPSTVANVTSGKEVSSLTLRGVEGGLGLPARFLDYVIAGDAGAIRRLPGRAIDAQTGLREDLRHYTLEAMADIGVPQRRRVGDR